MRKVRRHIYLLILLLPLMVGHAPNSDAPSTGATGGSGTSLLVTGADADSTTLQSDSGLELIGGLLTLLRGCADGEVLKWDEVTDDDWNCAADLDTGGSTLWSGIGNPVGDKTLVFGDGEDTTFTITHTSGDTNFMVFDVSQTDDAFATDDLDVLRIEFNTLSTDAGDTLQGIVIELENAAGTTGVDSAIQISNLELDDNSMPIGILIDGATDGITTGIDASDDVISGAALAIGDNTITTTAEILTAAELNTLQDGSNADVLHVHDQLVAASTPDIRQVAVASCPSGFYLDLDSDDTFDPTNDPPETCLQRSEIYYAVDYAVGSSTGGIQEATNALEASANSCGTVMAPAGVTVIDLDVATAGIILPECIMLQGYGHFKNVSGGTFLDFTNAQGKTAITVEDDHTGILDMGINLRDPVAVDATSIAVKCQHVALQVLSGFFMENVFVSSADKAGVGIQFNACLKGHLENVTSQNWGAALQIKNRTGSRQNNAYLLSNSYFTTSNIGIEYVSSDGNSQVASSGMISGGVIEANDIGIQIKDSINVIVVGVHFENLVGCTDLFDTGGPPQVSGDPDGFCDSDGTSFTGTNVLISNDAVGGTLMSYGNRYGGAVAAGRDIVRLDQFGFRFTDTSYGDNFKAGVDYSGTSQALKIYSRSNKQTGSTFTGVFLDDENPVFEGSSHDGFRTTFSITNPTAQRVITVPNANATVHQPFTCSNEFARSSAATTGLVACEAIVDADVPDTINIDHSSTGTLTLDQTTGPTAEGVIAWDATNEEIEVGETTTTAIFKPVVAFNDEQFCTAETTGNQIDCDVSGALADDDVTDDNLGDLADVDVATGLADFQFLIRDQSTDTDWENVLLSGDIDNVSVLGVVTVAATHSGSAHHSVFVPNADPGVDHTALAGGDGVAEVGGVIDTASNEANFLEVGTIAAAADEALVIDSDGNGTIFDTDTLVYQSGAEDFFVMGVREYPTDSDGLVLTYNATNDDVEWRTPAGGGTMSTWLFDGDDNDPRTVNDGETVTITGGAGIDTNTEASEAAPEVILVFDAAEIDGTTTWGTGTTQTFSWSAGAVDPQLTLTSGVATLSDGATTEVDWIVEGAIASQDGGGAQAAIILNAATTFAVSTNSVTLVCTGPETLNTITGGVIGQRLVILNIDTTTDCTIADDDQPTAANAIDLDGAASNFVMAAEDVLLLQFDGTGTAHWQEVARSVAGAGGNHNILSATHSDTLAASVVDGDIMIGNVTPVWSRLAAGTADNYLSMGALRPEWIGLTLADADNQGTTTTLLHGNAGGAVSFGAIVDGDLSLTTPALGTPSALVLTSATGLVAAGIVDGIVDFPAIDYANENVAADVTLAVDECYFVADAGGLFGGIVCEGSAADASEQVYTFPDVNTADSEQEFIFDDTAFVGEVTGDIGATVVAGTHSGTAHHADESAASEGTAGILEIATQAEADGFTDDARAITSLKLASIPFAGEVTGDIEATVVAGTHSGTAHHADESVATNAVVGIIEHATQAEVDAGTAGNLAVIASTHDAATMTGDLSGTFAAATVVNMQADAVAQIGDIDATIKTDDADTLLATTSAADPAGNECVEMDSSGSLVLAGDTCANLGPGGSTAIDALANAGAGDDVVGLAEQGQTWTWDTATTAAILSGLKLELVYDPATADSGEQAILHLTQTDSAGDAVGTPDALLLIENLEATVGDAVLAGIEIRATTAAAMPIAIDLTADEIVTALAIGSNVLTTGVGTITSAELDRLTGKDAALVDVDDAVDVAITGTNSAFFAIDADNNPADAGALRLNNATTVIWEDTENTQEVSITVSAAETFTVTATELGIALVTTTATECVMLDAAGINCKTAGGCTTADVAGSAFDYTVAEFTDAVTSGHWTFELPENFNAASAVAATVIWTSDDAACDGGATRDVCWAMDGDSVPASGLWETAILDGTQVAATDNCHTDGDLLEIALPAFTHSMVAGERAIVEILRDSTGLAAECGPAADDDYTGNADLLAVRFCYEVNNLLSGE